MLKVIVQKKCIENNYLTFGIRGSGLTKDNGEIEFKHIFSFDVIHNEHQEINYYDVPKDNDILPYCFDPLKHGFEPITNYPELSFNYPMIDDYFVKIVGYADYGDLVYWYIVIGFKPDDRIKISDGSYDFRKPSDFGKQTKSKTIYLGLVSNDEFAENLLKHLLGTTSNESLNTDSITRYNENLGIKMRSEFPQHYKK